MEDIDGGLHPAVDGQSLHDDDDDRNGCLLGCCCWLVAECPSNMLVYHGDRYAQTIVYRGLPTRMVYLKHDI